MTSMRPRRAAMCGFLAAITLAPAAGADPPPFALEELSVAPPLARAKVWAPQDRGSGPWPTVVLLHGWQRRTIEDPCWLASIRRHAPFDRTILVVPAVPRQKIWSRRATARAIASLLDRVESRAPVDRERVFLVGYSAGARYGFRMAASLRPRLAGYASLAGDIFGASSGQLSRLRDLPVLLACMEHDRTIPCNGQPTVERRLRAHGVRVERVRLAGLDHEINLARIAPVLAGWMGRAQP